LWPIARSETESPDRFLTPKMPGQSLFFWPSRLRGRPCPGAKDCIRQKRRGVGRCKSPLPQSQRSLSLHELKPKQREDKRRFEIYHGVQSLPKPSLAELKSPPLRISEIAAMFPFAASAHSASSIKLESNQSMLITSSQCSQAATHLLTIAPTTLALKIPLNAKLMARSSQTWQFPHNSKVPVKCRASTSPESPKIPSHTQPSIYSLSSWFKQ